MKFVNLLQHVFIFGFFASVFVFWLRTDVPFELPKVWFVLRWIEIIAISSIFFIRTLKKEHLDSKLIGLVLIFLFLGVVSSLFGADINKSFTGNYYRLDGLTTLFHLILLFFTVLLFAKKDWIVSFAKTVSFSAVILSALSIGQLVLNAVGMTNFKLWDGGFGNVFGNPNFLSGYLIVTLPFTAYVVDQSREKSKFLKLGLIIQIAGILLTKTWVGYFGIFLFLIFWTLNKIKKFKIGVGLIGAVFLVFMALSFVNYQKDLESPTSINPESRQRILAKGFLAIENRPFTGYGWANFDKAFESVDYPIHMDQDVYVDKAHSSLLEVLVTTGFFGVLTYVGIIVKVFYNLVKKNNISLNKYYLGVFVLLILHMQTNVISISEELLFWIIAGFSAKDCN